MTKKRKIEVLEILKKFIRDEKIDGLCVAVSILEHRKKISDTESKFLGELISKNQPKKWYDSLYYYNPYNKSPRIKWINARIKELENG